MSYDPQQPQRPIPPYTPGPPQPSYGPPSQHQPPPTGYGPPGMPQTRPLMPPGPPKKTWSPASIIAVVAAGVAVVCTGIGAIANLGGDKKTSSGTTVSSPKKSGSAAGTGKAKPAAEPTADGSFNVAIGSTITSDDGDGNIIEATLRSVRAVKKTCSSLDDGPENGLYVIVNVIVVQKKGEGSVNPLDFTFVADDGTSNNELTGGFSGCEKPPLDSADLRAGQKRAGEMAFDVNSKAGTLEWAPGGLGADTVGSWKTP